MWQRCHTPVAAFFQLAVIQWPVLGIELADDREVLLHVRRQHQLNDQLPHFAVLCLQTDHSKATGICCQSVFMAATGCSHHTNCDNVPMLRMCTSHPWL